MDACGFQYLVIFSSNEMNTKSFWWLLPKENPKRLTRVPPASSQPSEPGETWPNNRKPQCVEAIQSKWVHWGNDSFSLSLQCSQHTEPWHNSQYHTNTHGALQCVSDGSYLLFLWVPLSKVITKMTGGFCCPNRAIPLRPQHTDMIELTFFTYGCISYHL